MTFDWKFRLLQAMNREMGYLTPEQQFCFLPMLGNVLLFKTKILPQTCFTGVGEDYLTVRMARMDKSVDLKFPLLSSKDFQLVCNETRVLGINVSSDDVVNGLFLKEFETALLKALNLWDPMQGKPPKTSTPGSKIQSPFNKET